MGTTKSNSSDSSSRKRKSRLFGRFLIKKRLQIKLSFFALLFVLFGIFLVYFSGNFALLRLINQGIITDEIVITKMELLNRQVFLFALGGMTLLFSLCIIVTNFIAGPIYRIEETFRRIGRGDLSMTVEIRKRDELQDTIKVINHAITNLRNKIHNNEKLKLE